MNRVLDPALTHCPECPGWQVPCDTETQKQRLEEIHGHGKHGKPMSPQPVAGGNWQEQAIDAVRQVAARGKDFTVYEALAEFGLQSPPDAQHKLGRFASLMHDMGIAHPVTGAPSKRPATKGSQAGVWNRNPARCTSSELRCRAKAGVR